MKIVLLVAALVMVPLAEAKQCRSSVVRTAFAKAVACPATGQNKLPCPGYVIDHIVPLCAGGLDKISNLQWSGLADSKIKDKEEISLCAKVRRGLVKASSSKTNLCPVVKAQSMPQLTAALCKTL